MFSVTPAERILWGVRYENGNLSLKTTGWRQALGSFHVVGLGVLVRVVVAAGRWNAVQLAFGAVWLAASLVVCAQMWFGAVVATPEGVTLRWFVRRRFSWDRVDYMELVERRPYWGDLGNWIAVDVIDLALRDGRHVTLWPTRSSNHSPGGGDCDPSAAAVKLGLLTRYREACAPPV